MSPALGRSSALKAPRFVDHVGACRSRSEPTVRTSVGRAAASRALHAPPMPSVYVYPFDRTLTGEHVYDNLTAGDHDYHFKAELELTQRFREMPQADPAQADMLLVPVMMTGLFTKLRKGRNSPGHAQLLAWNDRAVAAMRAIGPYWDTRRPRHAVFSQRCAGPPYEANGLRKRSLAVHTWPQLWDENVTLLCFEPATVTHMGRGIFIPYGVGHGARSLRCPAGHDSTQAGDPPLPSAPRRAQLIFAGSVATNPARKPWVDAMRSVGEPRCRLVLFDKATRKHFNPSELEAALRDASFSVHLKGHVGPRKAIMDSLRCGSLPVIASDRTPFPFSDEIDYAAFALRVSERANATRVLAALDRFSEQDLQLMRAAMARAAHLLDCGPNGGMAAAVLARFVRVADRVIQAVPAATHTPLPLLKY